MPDRIKVCVAGAGAIGGILAARFALAGHEVSVIARGPHLAAILRHGLVLVDHLDSQTRTTHRLEADGDPQALSDRIGPQDVIILAAKANALGQLLPRISPLMHAETLVVPAINGLPWWYFAREGGPHEGRVIKAVDPQGALMAAIDARHIIGCVVHLAGEVRAPGEVHHTAGRRLIFGEIDVGLPDAATSRVTNLNAAVNGAGLEGIVSRAIRQDVWVKLVGNLSFNPVAALTGALMDAICADERLVEVLVPMLNEGMEVARAFGIPVAMSASERIDLARQLGRAKISMLQDFEAGRPPEIDAIVGSVLELAELSNVPAPTVRLVDALVRARARHLGLLAA
jgi:2-dehydropantoate 2-reductase